MSNALYFYLRQGRELLQRRRHVRHVRGNRLESECFLLEKFRDSGVHGGGVRGAHVRKGIAAFVTPLPFVQVAIGKLRQGSEGQVEQVLNRGHDAKFVRVEKVGSCGGRHQYGVGDGATAAVGTICEVLRSSVGRKKEREIERFAQ